MKTSFPFPEDMKKPDGSSRYAYVTFLMGNDGYLPGALMTARGLRRIGTPADLVCLVTPEISGQARQALGTLYDHVIETDALYMPSHRSRQRPELPYVFTRLQALRLGADGDLGPSYEKIVLLDADILPIRLYDHLFTLRAPAGILNERREYCLDYDPEGKFIIPRRTLITGEWKWHSIYRDMCPHGRPIPAYITDRVLRDAGNMGVNASVLVLIPSAGELLRIEDDLRRPEIRSAVSERFHWPEMQYLTQRWSGRWTNVDIRFGSFNGYPFVDALFGIHYCGLKPWDTGRPRQLDHYGRHPDFQYWYRQYIDMLGEYPALGKIPRLGHVLAAALRLSHAAPRPKAAGRRAPPQDSLPAAAMESWV